MPCVTPEAVRRIRRGYLHLQLRWPRDKSCLRP
ncbi:cathepsin E, isoform CRA_d [Rattus norvegicus]|uniref:Cathepsin E, isoform CRA_d n=1 Tax=Rattus norvegicus TaxID=10116 RepID=A6IC24_RAT|nr:cathepsin E, isoform CRA_d [Rattus norvegicus]